MTVLATNDGELSRSSQALASRAMLSYISS